MGGGREGGKRDKQDSVRLSSNFGSRRLWVKFATEAPFLVGLVEIGKTIGLICQVF